MRNFGKCHRLKKLYHNRCLKCDKCCSMGSSININKKGLGCTNVQAMQLGTHLLKYVFMDISPKWEIHSKVRKNISETPCIPCIKRKTCKSGLNGYVCVCRRPVIQVPVQAQFFLLKCYKWRILKPNQNLKLY